MQRFRSLRLVGAALVFASACGKMTSQGGDSETHWLADCDRTAECGTAAACICGKCTVSCDESTLCEDGPPGSTCTPAAEYAGCASATSPPAKLCLSASREKDAGGGARGPANPTGTCTGGDPSRPGYSVAASGDVWMPDCKNPLRREYWRVNLQKNGLAYVLPRPDGARELTGPCNDPKHPLASLAAKYRLCQSATSDDDVNVINSMDLAEALQITHYMHGVLAFQSEPLDATTADVRPYAMPGDVLEACMMHPSQNSAALTDYCARYRENEQSGNDVYITPNEPAATELSAVLDELYGITCPANGIPREACTACGPVDQCAAWSRICTVRCTSAVECTDVSLPFCDRYCRPGPCG